MEAIREGLAAAFLSRREPEAAEDDADAGTLEEAVRAAQAAWPAFAIAGDSFTAYLGERVEGGVPAAQALAGLHLADLYLACGCARGVPAALAALEERLRATVVSCAAKMRTEKSVADDVGQRVRVRLLVGEEDEDEERLPRILQYQGRGPLDGWLRVAVTRELVSDARRGSRETSLDEALMASSAADPEMEILRGRYLEDFRAAVKEVVGRELSALGPEQRNLLRWHLVENVSLRKIAVIRGTNVSAVAREFARVRASIMESVRVALRARTGLSAPDVDAIITALASRISLSISAILRRG